MLVCICERQRLPVSQPTEGRTGDAQKDRGLAEGNGGRCVHWHQLQRVRCHPKPGVGAGEGSISRFTASQDSTDLFLCGSAALHGNSGAEPHVCTGQLLGKS